MSDLFSAAESALGYLYQCRLALMESLRRAREMKGDAVALEAFDDIHFEENGTPLELLQAKHRSRPANLSNSSSDLWKTIRVWINFHKTSGIAFGEVELILVTTERAIEGSIAAYLSSDARDEPQALLSLVETANRSTSADNQAGITAFLALNETQRTAFVGSISIITQASNIEDVRRLVANELRMHVLPKFLDSFLIRVEGWWFQQCVTCLGNHSIQPISFQSLHETVVELARQFDEDNLPVDLELPERDEVDRETFVFVQQLREIGMTNEIIDLAVRNYFRAFQNRSRWQREDLLLVGELGKYERQLIEEWEHLFAMMRVRIGDSHDEAVARVRGFELYGTLHEMHIPIRPKVSERAVYRGTLHMLANDLRIGWHCSFKERLQHLLEVALR